MVTVKKISCIVFVLIVLSAGASWSALTTSHLGTDAEMLGLLSDTLFVGEGRIGDGAGAATFEVDLGGDFGDPDQTAQYDWPNESAVSWTLTYDHVTYLATFTVDDVVLSYVSPLAGFTEIFLRTRAVNADSDIIVDNLVLDGENVNDVSNAVGSNGLDILWISGAILLDGFTLTGQTTMSWTGTPPTQSRLAFQIKIGTIKTVPTKGSTWGGVKALYRQ